MKKKITKITLKTDKIVSLSKDQAQNLAGGQRSKSVLSWIGFCDSQMC
ncbi:class I lanthipeptide [Spirosoma gilvum]